MAKGTAFGGADILVCLESASAGGVLAVAELIRIASGDKNVPIVRFDDGQECLFHFALRRSEFSAHPPGRTRTVPVEPQALTAV